MLRLLHTADVHLGARHTDLGERASLQRERQFDAFRASIDLAIAEGVDLFLIAGDLFDSNTQPRRSVERVAAELGRLARASIRTVIIPGTHDVYDGASIYRAYDLPALARADGDWVVVLTPDRAEVVFPSLDAIVYGRVFDTKRAPESPLAGLDTDADARATWRIGMIHGALAIPGRTDGDAVVFSEAEIAATKLDYLALGHWHSTLQGRAGAVVYAYSGAPEPVALDQDGAGDVLLVSLDERAGERRVNVERRTVGRTRCESLDVDVAAIHSQPDLVDLLARRADPNLILDVRLTGLLPDHLDLAVDEVERELTASFLRLRVRDLSIPGVFDEALPPADTVLGSFVRIVEARIAALESPEQATPDDGVATEPDATGSNGHRARGDENDAADALVVAEAIAAEGIAAEGIAGGAEAATAAQGDVTALGSDELAVEAIEPEPAADVDAVAEAIAGDGTAAMDELWTLAGGDEPPAPDAPVASNAPAPAEAPADADAAAAAASQAASDAALDDLLAAATFAAPGGLSDEQRTQELADLREVLRLGRHLLEGRQVTL